MSERRPPPLASPAFRLRVETAVAVMERRLLELESVASEDLLQGTRDSVAGLRVLLEEMDRIERLIASAKAGPVVRIEDLHKLPVLNPEGWEMGSASDPKRLETKYLFSVLLNASDNAAADLLWFVFTHEDQVATIHRHKGVLVVGMGKVG